MDEKHTPGPWEQSGTEVYAVNQGVICQVSEIRRDDKLVIHSKIDITSPDWNEAMANAALIAAAPGLLRASESALQIFTEKFKPDLADEECWYFYDKVKSILEAAIAKARGE